MLPDAGPAAASADELASLALPPLWSGDRPDPAGWRRRSAELVETFAGTMYGRTPPGGRLAFAVEHGAETGVLDGRADRLRHRAVLGGPRGAMVVDTLLHVPARATGERPVPIVVGLTFTDVDDTIDGPQADRWPYELIADAGFAVLTADYRQVEPDDPDAQGVGARALFDSGSGGAEGDAPWGALGAWAWGLSRLLDLAATIPRLDTTRSLALGHSRLGKAALWAAAQDQRFAVAVSNDSGCAGASLFRHPGGEDLATITTAFPHWFTPAFARFAAAEDALPMDQHQLLASIAPRAVYVASAEDDHWADPVGERLAMAAAEPAFRLHGAESAIGGHLRPGGHDLTPVDWQHILRFARERFARSA